MVRHFPSSPRAQKKSSIRLGGVLSCGVTYSAAVVTGQRCASRYHRISFPLPGPTHLNGSW